MKKLVSVLLALALLSGTTALAASEEPTAADEIDAYTTASTTKNQLAEDDLSDAAAFLAANGSDLATLAETEEPGYEAPDSLRGHIMTVNPDGTVGISTITEWQYVPQEDGNDQLILELTYGQNALNLTEPDARGTLLVIGDGVSYLVHLDVLDADEQVYTDEAYAAGEFNSHYSGAENHFSSYTITCQVLSIETSYLLMFN
jgi:hypothetical protein